LFYFRLIFTSIRSLDTNFLRSLLATLGVLIGVSSVVACMSIMEGFSRDFQERFKSMGSNVLYVQPASIRVGGRHGFRAQSLELDDVEMLRRECGGDIDGLAPYAIGSATIRRFQKSDTYTVIATSQDYFSINAFDAESGRPLNKAECNDEGANVVCLGAEVAKALFGGIDPVGQSVKVRNVGYRVVGVMEERGSLGFLNVDECVFIPIKVGLQRFLNRKWLDGITVSITDPTTTDAVETKVKRTLRQQHRIRAGDEDDFSIFKQQEAMNSINEAMLIWKVVFYSIAGISLVVGGIGIMNIMLVSVTERTREIGVRIAVGARRWDILLQFLVEAIVISFLGGGFGLLLGSMFADLLEKVLQNTGMFKIAITPLIIAVAIVTSSIVGIASGLYPAYKASRLDPVEALRYE
jgi:putative ABC transport system permease protein